MRLKILATSLPVAVAGLLTSSIATKASIEIPEACHRTGYCWTYTINSKEALSSNELGTLYLLDETISSYPPDPNGSYYIDNPASDATMDYEKFVRTHGTSFVSEPMQSYVFCSRNIPSVSFEEEIGYRVSRLALFETPYDLYRTLHQKYLAACHSLVGPDYFSSNVYSMLLKEGYTTDYVEQTESFFVDAPSEMMQLEPRSFQP